MHSETPYCVTWTYTSDQVADYGCATSPLGVLTVEQFASDTESIYSITLPTLSGLAVTGWDSETSSVDSDVTTDFSSTSIDPSDPEATTPVPGSNGSNDNTPKPKTTKKSTPVGVIAGAVVGGLVVLFLIGAAIIFFCVKRRKAKQLANNQTIIAAQQAQPHQSEYKPVVQSPPMPMQSPPPQGTGYFTPQDQKTNYQPLNQVHNQGPQSPVLSNPPTPAPPYMHPYYAAPNAPPLPAEGSAQYPAAREGTYEVDAITASHARPAQQPNTFEMGTGK
ncbi:uncharacterized protein N0V89_011265 [Didymosphaeria variabile]|uniref:Mid2 domain-containing protein n=1 Tax=Didymosphaeria variabile TaxID=1932322 RepID=A0A9W8XEF3_9PLEO|nr:uncharacterized protein N0V89_011265 [Didymosphaeria variabile]KAJ4347324.1 hypothetical protein N0V89_011265 [Didymosphaeria variabile]